MQIVSRTYFSLFFSLFFHFFFIYNSWNEHCTFLFIFVDSWVLHLFYIRDLFRPTNFIGLSCICCVVGLKLYRIEYKFRPKWQWDFKSIKSEKYLNIYSEDLDGKNKKKLYEFWYWSSDQNIWLWTLFAVTNICGHPYGGHI